MTTISIRGVSLFVKVIGHGYPLVLMHGGPGTDHNTMLSFRPCADRFTLVFYDHRCNGRSEGADVSSMTWENLTADADALRQALGFDKWAVLGHSFGGMVALEYALRYPQSLSHLLLLDTCGDTWWVRQNAPQILAKRGFRPAAVETARRFYTGQIEPEDHLLSSLKLARAFYHRLTPLVLARDMALGLGVKSQPEAFLFAARHLLKGWNVMDRLGEIKVPTLVLAGRDDFQFPPEHQAILADRLPNARLELIERAGHNAPTERSAEVIQAVRDFMATVTPSGA
jgi:proline iminopeptidase